MFENCGSCFAAEQFVDIKLGAKCLLTLTSFYENPDGGVGGEQVGQGHAGAQGADRQHQRHRRSVHRPEVAVEQEQNADAQVAAALDAEVARAHGNDFLRIVPHENGQQLGSEAADQPADQQTKDQHPEQGPFRPGFDAPPLPGPVVLGDEGGVGVAEVLHGHVGQGVDLHRHGERNIRRKSRRSYAD